MWGSNDTTQAGGEGTGFFDTTSKFDSPGTGKKQGGTKRAQSVTPIVIGMINKCEQEEFTMWTYPTTILKLVCIARKFEVTSTTVTYKLEDHTGKINAVLWLEHDSASKPNVPVDQENIYVRVYGTLRNKGNEKLIMILKIAPIDKLNELTCHLLEVIHVRVMTEKKSKGELTLGSKASNPSAELTNSMMEFANGATEEAGMPPVQREIYRFMKTIKTEEGASRSAIMDNFSPNQKREVDEAIQFLVSEGHIFSTIDHDHYQITTSS